VSLKEAHTNGRSESDAVTVTGTSLPLGEPQPLHQDASRMSQLQTGEPHHNVPQLLNGESKTWTVYSCRRTPELQIMLVASPRNHFRKQPPGLSRRALQRALPTSFPGSEHHQLASAAISIRRVARLSRTVGQPDHIFANPVISHRAERRPWSGEIWLAVTKHDGVQGRFDTHR